MKKWGSMKNNRFKHRLFLTTFASFYLIFFYSCETNEEIGYHNQYIFLEQHKFTQNERLEGEYNHLTFDFATYSFDSLTGILTDYLGNMKMNKSIRMVLGTGDSASGDALSGEATHLKGIQETPSEHNDFIITKIDDDGTVYFTYKDSTMVLLPNEKWMHISTEIVEDTLGTVKYTYTDRITNWGLLDKENFVEAD